MTTKLKVGQNRMVVYGEIIIKIQSILNLPWKEGEELKKREGIRTVDDDSFTFPCYWRKA